ncbi:hypothetical protein Tco_1544683 [Tanacetum coccineum]
MPGRPPVNRKKDKSEMKNQKHVARPPRSMTWKNCGETGHNKNGCEKPKVPGEQANPPNEQPNRASQQVSSQSMDKFVTTRGGIWMGGTSASGSNRGRGSASGSNRARGSASGSNRGRGRGSASGSNRGRGRGRASGSNKVFVKKPVVDKYILLDEDDLVDVQVEEEVDTRYENVAAGVAEQDENQDEAARIKRNCEELCEPQDKGARSLEEQDEAARLKGRVWEQHFVRDEVDAGNQMVGQESQTIDEV